jgi:hypothetical protein
MMSSAALPAWLQFISVILAITFFWSDKTDRNEELHSDKVTQTLALINEYYTDFERQRSITQFFLMPEKERVQYIKESFDDTYNNSQYISTFFWTLTRCLENQLCDLRTAKDMICFDTRAIIEYAEFLRKNGHWLPNSLDHFYANHCLEIVARMEAAIDWATKRSESLRPLGKE